MEKRYAIDIKNLTKFYGDFRALNKINFKIKQGEFFGFLGPNGAGKTTTIRCLIGLSNFKSGSIKVFGKDVMDDYRTTRRLIGFSPQEFNFDLFMSAKEILMYSAGYFGIEKWKAEKRADELLEFFELSTKKRSDIRKLSGGMKRRLTIARALMHKPRILILDEPTAGVDVELRRSLWKYITKLNKEGTTIFLTTHYLEEAEKLCDRIGVINHGKIIALDKKTSLINKLSNKCIIITLKKPLTIIPKDLEKYKFRLKNKKVLHFREEYDKLDTILKSIYKNNLEIEDMQLKQDNLEEIFLKLTKK